MKLASIFSLVALVASPFSASAVSQCTVSGEYSIDDVNTNPTNDEIDYAADTILSSYNACHNIASPPGEAETYTVSSFTMTGRASTLRQVQDRHPADGEEKQEVAENNLRAKVEVGRYVYSAFLEAIFSISCYLCVGDDDDYVPTSTLTDAAVSVVLEEKKLAVQKKHHGLSTTDLEDWELTWCDELVGYGPPFKYAYGCTITITCP